MRNLLIVPFFLATTACSTLNMMEPNDELAPGEGMLVAYLRGNSSYTLDLRNKDTGYSKQIVHQTVNNDNNYSRIVLGVPPGNYQILAIFQGKMRNTFHGDPRYSFNIAAGKINYLCDIDIQFEKIAGDFGIIKFNPSGNRSYNMRVYHSKQTLDALRKQYPRQFAKYELRDADLPLCAK